MSISEVKARVGNFEKSARKPIFRTSGSYRPATATDTRFFFSFSEHLIDCCRDVKRRKKYDKNDFKINCLPLL